MAYIGDDPKVQALQEERRYKILNDLDVRRKVGVEIGALCRPFVRESDGEVIYVDHADTPALREKYKNDPHVDLESIVNVAAVWGENTLSQAIDNRKVDYVIASHVIEHVPDMIGWLQEIAAVLNPGGELRLIIPDKRFTFDYLREETRIENLIPSFLAHARIPQPAQLFDFAFHAAKVECEDLWREKPDADKLVRHYDFQNALGLANDALINGNYHDVHCWVFTPKSFARLMYDLTSTGLVDFTCDSFQETERDRIDIYVNMRLSGDKQANLASWRDMVSSASI